MKKILVVEDHDICYEIVKKELEGKVNILRAETLSEGAKLFKKNADVDLIIMDACVPGDRPNAMALVSKIIASGFNKPIIASSSIEEYSRRLLAVGATHEAGKIDAAKIALNLLGL